MPEAGWMRTTPVLLESNTVVWRDLFNKSQLDALEKQCDAMTLEAARLSSGKTSNIRSTGIAWLHRTPETEDLYLRMEAVVLKLNMDLFHADLTCMLPFQFAVYTANGGGYFDWHSDYGRRADAPEQEPRKITLSLQLSDGASYDGCDLEVRTGHPVDVAPRERGTLVAFWSNALHRVTPITRGVRKSLVMWAAGPEFR